MKDKNALAGSYHYYGIISAPEHMPSEVESELCMEDFRHHSAMMVWPNAEYRPKFTQWLVDHDMPLEIGYVVMIGAGRTSRAVDRTP